jgi:hypothetical protein
MYIFPFRVVEADPTRGAGYGDVDVITERESTSNVEFISMKIALDSFQFRQNQGPSKGGDKVFRDK